MRGVGAEPSMRVCRVPVMWDLCGARCPFYEGIWIFSVNRTPKVWGTVAVGHVFPKGGYMCVVLCKCNFYCYCCVCACVW